MVIHQLMKLPSNINECGNGQSADLRHIVPYTTVKNNDLLTTYWLESFLKKRSKASAVELEQLRILCL